MTPFEVRLQARGWRCKRGAGGWRYWVKRHTVCCISPGLGLRVRFFRHAWAWVGALSGLVLEVHKQTGFGDWYVEVDYDSI